MSATDKSPFFNIASVVFFGLLALLVWMFWPAPSLASAPRLTVALEESKVRFDMSRTSVSNATLFCDAKTKKVGATFGFYKTDGRPSVTVVGTAACQQSGPLVTWEAVDARQREAYDPTMVIAQLTTLFAQANIPANNEERVNYELGGMLSKKYAAQYMQKPVWAVEFQCENKGEPLRYVATYLPGRVERGTVKARCSRDAEEFTIMPEQPNPYREGERIRGEVHQYHELPVAMVDSAYGEFLTTPELKKSF